MAGNVPGRGGTPPSDRCRPPFFFSLPERGEGEITCTLAAAKRDDDATCWQCQYGVFSLTRAEPVLNFFSRFPACRQDEEWCWDRYNQAMSAEITTLFRSLTPARETVIDAPLTVNLRVAQADYAACCQLTASVNLLFSLLDSQTWHRLRHPSSLPYLHLPLRVGALSLTAHQLRTLRPQDVLLPQQDDFQPTGEGVIRCARLLLRGKVQHVRGQVVFLLTEHARDRSHTATIYPEDFMYETDETDGVPHEPDDPLGDLPLHLTLQCGRIVITQSELQCLAPGAVLTTQNATPDRAILCYDQQVIAEGELIAVNKKTGFMIKRLFPAISGQTV